MLVEEFFYGDSVVAWYDWRYAERSQKRNRLFSRVRRQVISGIQDKFNFTRQIIDETEVSCFAEAVFYRRIRIVFFYSDCFHRNFSNRELSRPGFLQSGQDALFVFFGVL